MPESTSMALRMESSKDPQPTDALEERLSKAEKAVAIALDTFAYDELILVATEALKTRSQTLSKTVIKCRKNLLWARSHAYHHQNRYELALKDARAALKIDPDDVAAYIRAAALLFNTGHKEQAFSCLDTAQSLASKHGSATRALLLSRIDKQRRKVSGLSWRLIDRLPNEIFIEIASHLEIQDRSSMSQTCRAWRQILISVPSLWTSLTLITKHKEMGESKAVGWMRYIILRSERANHCLEYVSFKHAFPEKLLEKLRKLSFKEGGASEHRQDVRDALFNLRHLEELDMAEMSARDHDLTCGQLVPRPVSSESGQIELHVPLPNLRLLVVDGGSDTFLYKLAVCLLAREQVRLGDGLVTAMRLAQDRALPKSSPAAAVSPFQRGITSTSRRNEAKELGGPRLKHGSDCARLHLLKLAKVVALPDHLRATLEGVTDKLIIEYGRL
ncbi:hypothetical protein EX895_005003 [Sporisorium graminicola]|uniref:F-box domain-containing protein n=1 Tax=Sporisorium graminicola TaxID=280036 RepID=A0A4U7KSE2_9BASI|nr:hypothetical protein EX895_005003 [Sporisorium graminicola]TKY86178.1 hypothetical protein EX895_005003 [Sporisorium graminicola]